MAGGLHGGVDDDRASKRNPRRVEAHHLLGVEVREQAPVMRPPAQYPQPARSRLRAFRHREFEQGAVRMNRHAPSFGVMILSVRRVRVGSWAAPRAGIGYTAGHPAPGKGSNICHVPAASIRAWNQTGLRLLFETIEELEILPIMKNHGYP